MDYWAAIGQVAGQLGFYDLMNQLNRTTDPNKVSELASKVLDAAAQKGNAALRKAEAAISNIPSIASSPSVQARLRAKRKEALNNYTNVEKRVNAMNADAQNQANRISDINNKPMVQKLLRGRSMMQNAQQDANAFINKINQTDLNKIEEKI